MSIRDHFVVTEPEKAPTSLLGDYLFAPYWSGLIDARLTERDRKFWRRFAWLAPKTEVGFYAVQGGVRAIHQFLQEGYRPIE